MSLPGRLWTFIVRLNRQNEDRPTLKDEECAMPRGKNLCLCRYSALGLASPKICRGALRYPNWQKIDKNDTQPLCCKFLDEFNYRRVYVMFILCEPWRTGSLTRFCARLVLESQPPSQFSSWILTIQMASNPFWKHVIC